MNISLTPELEAMVQAQVAGGQYSSASEVVREALRLMIQRDLLGRYYEEWLEAQIEVGWQQAQQGAVEAHQMQDILDEVLHTRAEQDS